MAKKRTAAAPAPPATAATAAAPAPAKKKRKPKTAAQLQRTIDTASRQLAKMATKTEAKPKKPAANPSTKATAKK